MRGRDFAAQLSMRVLSRAWQMLLKGMTEVQASGRPLAAAEMVLVRIAYAADLPTPDEVVRSLGEEGCCLGAPARQWRRGAAQRRRISRRATKRRAEARARPPRCRRGRPTSRWPRPVRPPRRLSIGSFADLIALAQDKRDITMKMALERDVRLVRCEDGQLEIALEARAPKTLVHDLQRKLGAWTGKRWMVVVSKEQGDADGARAGRGRVRPSSKRSVESDPLVQAVLETLSRRHDRRRHAEAGGQEARGAV